jgi:hypothetical protein
MRLPIELARSPGASVGHEIPTGSIGGKNDCEPDPRVADADDRAFEPDTESGASGEDPAQPTTRTLARRSNTHEDFI